MGQLHLFPGVVLFQIQAESNQAESNCNRFRILIRGLHCESIDDVLMNKRRIGMSECVITKLVEFFLEFVPVHDARHSASCVRSNSNHRGPSFQRKSGWALVELGVYSGNQ